jgi:hypothetical protein
MGRSKHSGGFWETFKAGAEELGASVADRMSGHKKPEAKPQKAQAKQESKKKKGEWKTTSPSAYSIRQHNVEMAEKIKKETGY